VIPARPRARGDTLLFRRIHHRPFKEIGDSQAHGAGLKIVAMDFMRVEDGSYDRRHFEWVCGIGLSRAAVRLPDRRAAPEALVPESIFRRVQLLLDHKGVPLRRHVRDREDFPLRRFVACSHCSTPLTGSWSTGRAKKYAYYHCRKCRRVKVAEGALEGRFVELLGTLRPEPAYMRLFNAIVLDVWKDRQNEVETLRRNLENVVSQERERLDRIDEAFLHERSIDRQTYERQRDQLREHLALAEIELNDAVLDQLDINGVLAFAEHVFTNAAGLWMELELVQKQRLQQVLFPEGLRFEGEKFGTAATCLAFKKLDQNGGPESGMASPPGFEPGFQP
jgi:site-specific DNA recombinase